MQDLTPLAISCALVLAAIAAGAWLRKAVDEYDDDNLHR